MISGQLSVVSYQWSVISYQWSVISGPYSVISGQYSVISGQLSVINERTEQTWFLAYLPHQLLSKKVCTSPFFQGSHQWSVN